MTNATIALISENNVTEVHTIDIKTIHTPTKLQSKCSDTTVMVSTTSMSVKSSRKVRISKV